MRFRRLSFDTLLESWLRELEAIGKSADTLRAYRSDLRLWHEAGVDAATYLLNLSANGAKPATVNRRRAALRSYHNWLIDHGHLDENPLDRTKPVKTARRLQRTLTVAEVARLIDSAQMLGKERASAPNVVHLGHMPVDVYRSRLAAMIALQVTSGLRVTELCTALVANVDLEKRTIRVIRKGDKEQQLRFGKSAAWRIIAWNVHRAPLPGPYLFCGSAGSAVLAKTYTRQLHEACWWAGLDPIHPHTLRHTFATLAIESGIRVEDVQLMLGHEQIATTMVYVHRHPDRGWDHYDRHALDDPEAVEV